MTISAWSTPTAAAVTQMMQQEFAVARGVAVVGGFCGKGLNLGMLDANGGHAIRLVNQFDVVKDVGAFLLQRLVHFYRNQADLSVGVRAAAQFQEVPPGSRIASDEDLSLAGVGQNGPRGLPSPLAPVTRRHSGMLLLHVLGGGFGQLRVSLADQI